ncbi:MAG: class I adenylate cyclase [Thermodesulfobacteriota bacterium]
MKAERAVKDREEAGGIDGSVIRRNRQFFNNYSRLRRQYAYEVSPERGAVAFEIIPALLNLNEPFLPGYVRDGAKACGISGMNISQDVRKAIYDYFPETRSRLNAYRSHFTNRPSIESLFLMGSIGTVAQTAKSDFDYWVCVDLSWISEEGAEKLNEKTANIARWCQDKFDMEVHFFVSDLEHIRTNDFGKVDQESTGSSQKKFLKEECYRTLLLVAGKVPFWWVLPTGIDERQYQGSWDWLIQQESYESDEYVDLGFLGEVPRDEFLGTALWQMSKGMQDPFKAVLKMAMMERYLSSSFQGPLLCETLKARVQGGVRDLGEMDPYLLMVETVLDFYAGQGPKEHAELLRKAFYIKSDPRITRTRMNRNGDPKTEIFKNLMRKWDWSLDLVEDLNQLENWSYARQLSLSTEISGFFFSTYRRLSEGLRLRERQAIDEHDLTFLGRRIYSLFARESNKLQTTPFLTSRRLILDRCIFQFERDSGGKARWVLFDATRYGQEKGETRTQIFAADRVARAAAWLVLNGLYDHYATAVEMPSNPSSLTLSDLIDLLKHMKGFFPPGFEQLKPGDDLKADAKRDKLMLVINIEEGQSAAEPVSMDLLCTNTWGEMFFERYPFREGLAVARGYASEMNTGAPVEWNSKVKVHVPRSLYEADEKRRILQALFQGL